MAFIPMARELAELGHRVIVYDGWGRGFSDRVSTQLFEGRWLLGLVKQLDELLTELSIDSAVIYGSSLGAAIAVRFARLRPERVMAIGYEAPLVRYDGSPLLLKLLKLPYLSAWLARVLMVPKIVARGECIGIDDDGRRAAENFMGQFRVYGTEANLHALITSDAVLGNRLEDHAAVGEQGIPAFFAYALDDPECPSSATEDAIVLYPFKIVKFYTGGHFFTNGKADVLAVEFDRFLRGESSGGAARRRRSSSPKR